MSFAPVEKVPEGGLHLLSYLFIQKDGRILLEKRLHPEYLRGKWSLPWDFPKYGEHPDDSADRIVKEQLGLKVTNIEQLFILSYTRAHEMIPTIPPHWDLCYVYRVEAEGEVRVDQKLISEAAYYSLHRLPSELTLFHRYIVKKTIPRLR